MRMRSEAMKTGMLLVVGLLLFFGPSAVAEAQEDAFSCSDCHEIAETFHANPHVRGHVDDDGVIPNAVCETCHGDATEHMEAGGDPELIFRPVGLEGSNMCMSCHDKSTFWSSRATGVHKNSENVNCLTCHEIHEPEPSEAHLLTKNQLDLCSSCHSSKAAQFRNKPFSHRLGRGGMECSSCHNPHGTRGEGMLARTHAGEVACLECHVDKRGPFVFAHGGKALGETCLNCHELHGSNNPRQLKRANVYQVCIECHSPMTGTTLGSQPPSFHELTDPRYQNCTSCHMAIHGSNRSPELLK